MAKLIAPDGKQLQIQGDEASVGRRDGGDFTPDLDLGELERGRTVSRRHARIFRKRAVWHLRVEPTATNTTKVGGRPLRPGEESQLNDGDEIELGAVALTFRADIDPDVTLVGRAQAPAELRVDSLVFPLAAPEGRRLWIGRRRPDIATGPEIDLSDVPGSRSVSHLHAQVYRTAGGWLLHEGKTTNPTMVAGRKLEPGEDVPLIDGTSIQLGRLVVTFHESRPVRVVSSDILLLDVTPQEISVEPGLQQTLSIRLVNATGRVEQVEVEIAGIPSEWYSIVQPDGTRGTTWRVQLVPTGPNLADPVPNSSAQAMLIVAPPRAPASRAGLYPVTISATTQGEDRVRRVVASRIRVLPFEIMQMTLSPTEAKGRGARLSAEVVNSGNADANVDLITEPDDGLIATPDPARVQVANGATQLATLKLRAKRHHWWGPKRTYGVRFSAVSGSQRSVAAAALTCSPIVPEWLQGILSKLYSMLSPIAIPAATLVLLLGLAYFFLRPPEIKDFSADPSGVAAGTPAQLSWNVDRAAGLSIEPPVEPKPSGAKGTLSVSPDVTTEYTLTARNWIGLSTSSKAKVSVVKIVSFTATPDHLNKEKDEVKLEWDTQGASSIKIDPDDEVKDAKPSGNASVHPSAATTYTLTATGPTGVAVQSQREVSIGAPAVPEFKVAPTPGTRITPGTAVQLNWAAAGATKAVLTVNKGEVVPGQKELDVTAEHTPTVRPTVVGELEYTLTVSNAAGNQQSTTKLVVTPPEITQFETDPENVSSGQSAKLRWRVEGANDTTLITIDPGIGKVEATGERAVSPTDTTEYVLKVQVQGSDAVAAERRRNITVRAPLPVISIFTAPRKSITLGEEVRLTWQVQNADAVEIRTGDNFVVAKSNQPSGSVQDIPAGPTTYILQATGPSGKVTQPLDIDVKPPVPTPVPVVLPLPGSPPGAPGGAAPAPPPTPAAQPVPVAPPNP